MSPLDFDHSKIHVLQGDIARHLRVTTRQCRPSGTGPLGFKSLKTEKI